MNRRKFFSALTAVPAVAIMGGDRQVLKIDGETLRNLTVHGQLVIDGSYNTLYNASIIGDPNNHYAVGIKVGSAS